MAPRLDTGALSGLAADLFAELCPAICGGQGCSVRSYGQLPRAASTAVSGAVEWACKSCRHPCRELWTPIAGALFAMPAPEPRTPVADSRPAPRRRKRWKRRPAPTRRRLRALRPRVLWRRRIQARRAGRLDRAGHTALEVDEGRNRIGMGLDAETHCDIHMYAKPSLGPGKRPLQRTPDRRGEQGTWQPRGGHVPCVHARAPARSASKTRFRAERARRPETAVATARRVVTMARSGRPCRPSGIPGRSARDLAATRHPGGSTASGHRAGRPPRSDDLRSRSR